MRIGFIFDPHVSDKSPSTRKDDYRKAILNKLDFCVSESNKRNYTALCIAGDLFHKKIPSHNSHSLISDLITIFKKSKCTIYIIPGNHDISGNLANLTQQPLYVLERADVLSILENRKPILLEEDGLQVSLNGVPFSMARDKKDAAPLYDLSHIKNVDCKIGLFHQMILPDGQKFFDDYINFSDLLEVNSDIIVDGHYHVGFDPTVQLVQDKYFINGGALSRGSSEQFNREKNPLYVELELKKGIGTGFSLSYENIVVPHEDGKKVFDMVSIERHKASKQMKEFIKNLSEFEADSLSSETPEGVMRMLGAMGMSKNLFPVAEGYLTKAYEDLGL